MASSSEIRAAIAASLTDAGILAFAYARDSVVPPEAQVGPLETIEYDYTAGRGLDRWLFPVRLYVSKSDEFTGQDELDAYLAGSGTLSVKQAIETETRWTSLDPTSVRVMAGRDEGMYRVGGVELLGVEFLVEVVV